MIIQQTASKRHVSSCIYWMTTPSGTVPSKKHLCFKYPVNSDPSFSQYVFPVLLLNLMNYGKHTSKLWLVTLSTSRIYLFRQQSRGLFSMLKSILQENGMSCASLGLPASDPTQIFEEEPELYIALEEEEAATQFAKHNNDMGMLVNSVLQDLAEIRGHPPKCGVYFLDGPGGRGKTMCYNTLISHCCSQGMNMASTAWTGIAATLLLRRKNLPHNPFKLPLQIFGHQYMQCVISIISC